MQAVIQSLLQRRRSRRAPYILLNLDSQLVPARKNPDNSCAVNGGSSGETAGI